MNDTQILARIIKISWEKAKEERKLFDERVIARAKKEGICEGGAWADEKRALIKRFGSTTADKIMNSNLIIPDKIWHDLKNKEKNEQSPNNK